MDKYYYICAIKNTLIMMKYLFIIAAVAAGLFFFSSCLNDKTEEINFEEYKKQGQEFLAENAKREGVTTTESGLQYEVLSFGMVDEVKSPTINDQVRCRYTGYFIDGRIFDSSKENSVIFPLNGVIKGWSEGLQHMTPGAKYRFYIPYYLGYGATGYASIPPYSTLIFDVELIEVIY